MISFTFAAVPRPGFSKLRTSVAAALSLGLILSFSGPRPAQAASTLNVLVGIGAGTVSGQVYAPGDVTVLVGDSVRFTVETDEEHSVTFGNGPAGVHPVDWPVSGFPGTVPPPPAVVAISGSYAGSGLLNTWLLSKGSSATVTFTAAGAFPFLCVIHAGMAGTVTAVASGPTTTQAEADAKGTLTRNSILGPVESLEAQQTANVTQTERADGTSLWNVFTNSSQGPTAQPGGGSGYLELYRFVPPSLDIQAGDTVRWTAPNAHTVSFPAAGQDPATINPFETPVTTSSTYDGTSLYHSGILEPGAPDTYQLTFPDAGTFSYVCALHLVLGQTGTIVVAAAPTITAPPTDVGPLSVRQPTGEAPWLLLALLAVLSACIVTSALMVRRR